jgi:hypothetical protein
MSNRNNRTEGQERFRQLITDGVRPNLWVTRETTLRRQREHNIRGRVLRLSRIFFTLNNSDRFVVTVIGMTCRRFRYYYRRLVGLPEVVVRMIYCFLDDDHNYNG